MSLFEPITIVQVSVHACTVQTREQVLSEELFYSRFLDAACTDTTMSAVDRMVAVTAFALASYANIIHRSRKPINPMLGETFSLDRFVA